MEPGNDINGWVSGFPAQPYMTTSFLGENNAIVEVFKKGISLINIDHIIDKDDGSCHIEFAKFAIWGKIKWRQTINQIYW